MADLDIEDLEEDTKVKREHELETRFQTVAMVLIVGFLTWVGTGLVDVKVGLANVLTQTVFLRETLQKQDTRLSQLESEINTLKRDFVTHDDLRNAIQQNRQGNNYQYWNQNPPNK